MVTIFSVCWTVLKRLFALPGVPPAGSEQVLQLLCGIGSAVRINPFQRSAGNIPQSRIVPVRGICNAVDHFSRSIAKNDGIRVVIETEARLIENNILIGGIKGKQFQKRRICSDTKKALGLNSAGQTARFCSARCSRAVMETPSIQRDGRTGAVIDFEPFFLAAQRVEHNLVNYDIAR